MFSISRHDHLLSDKCESLEDDDKLDTVFEVRIGHDETAVHVTNPPDNEERDMLIKILRFAAARLEEQNYDANVH